MSMHGGETPGQKRHVLLVNNVLGFIRVHTILRHRALQIRERRADDAGRGDGRVVTDITPVRRASHVRQTRASVAKYRGDPLTASMNRYFVLSSFELGKC